MKKDLKHLLMSSWKWRNIMPHSSSWQWSSNPPQLMWCQMKRIAVSNVKNQDILHDIALTLGAMYTINIVISSWTVHKEYLLPEIQKHFTNDTRVTMPDQVWGTAMKIKTGKASADQSPTMEDIAAWVIVIHTEAILDHNTVIDVATTEGAHNDLTQPIKDTATNVAMTHHTSHITDCLHLTAVWVINPEITIGHTHDHLTDLQGTNHEDQIHTLLGWDEGHIPRRAWRWRWKTCTLIITALMITLVPQTNRALS